MNIIIKAANGSTRGYTVDAGNLLEIHDKSGKLLGYYNKATDKTYSSSGTLVGYGNQLVMLLKD